MKNKVLVKILVPEIDGDFDVYLPLNKQVGNVLELLNKVLVDMTDGVFVPNKERTLFNRETGGVYLLNTFLKDTDIRNATTLILI